MPNNTTNVTVDLNNNTTTSTPVWTETQYATHVNIPEPVAYYTFENESPPDEAPGEPEPMPRVVRMNNLYQTDLRNLLQNSDPDDVFTIMFGDEELVTIDRYGDHEIYSSVENDLRRRYSKMKTSELLDNMEEIKSILKIRENSIYEEVE